MRRRHLRGICTVVMAEDGLVHQTSSTRVLRYYKYLPRTEKGLKFRRNFHTNERHLAYSAHISCDVYVYPALPQTGTMMICRFVASLALHVLVPAYTCAGARARARHTPERKASKNGVAHDNETFEVDARVGVPVESTHVVDLSK